MVVEGRMGRKKGWWKGGMMGEGRKIVITNNKVNKFKKQERRIE